ncbi:hypothetical protein CASFOL_010966 [Castilleja foliolosa]|uniref:X8 domain-containing protein n=1 Tax=Castilleja foliolosa TaxID=1961234 RepID=A0ABD3DU44_9LAMI
MEKSLIMIFLLLCSINMSVAQANSWCLLRANVPKETAQGFINYACGILDCTPIFPGASCYYPNTTASHASFALSLNYRRFGSCNPNIALVTVTDPSYGSCRYP